MSSQQRNTSFCKRKEFDEITKTYYNAKRSNIDNLLPTLVGENMTVTKQQDYGEIEQNKLGTLERNYQNIHPLLGWYKYDMETGHFSSDQFQKLLSTENEE